MTFCKIIPRNPISQAQDVREVQTPPIENLRIEEPCKADDAASKPQFDPYIHLTTPPPTDEQCAKIKELREKLQTEAMELYAAQETWLTDQQLQRFLIARNYDLKAAYDLFITALNWREKRTPDKVYDRENWEAFLSKERSIWRGKIVGDVL